MTTYEKYCASLRAQMDAITPEALAICRAWHGETFGTPGYGGETWVACEIGRANIAVKALDALRESWEMK